MRVGFTGTSKGMTPHQLWVVNTVLRGWTERVSMFHHGCCVGADTDAHHAAAELGLSIALHPPLDTKSMMVGLDADATEVHPPRPYLVRNHDIVDACDILIATPRTVDEELRSGTWATVRYAKKRRVATLMVWP